MSLSGSIPELPHVEKVENAASEKSARKRADRRLRLMMLSQIEWEDR
jgi:hypothetical protein